MKIVKTNTFYIFTGWILIIVLLGSVLYMGYKRNIKDLRQLMVKEAKRLTDIVTVATAVGIDALEDIEYLIAFRLLDNSRYIDRLSDDSVPSAETLARIAKEHDLYSIEILDKNGDSIVHTGPPQEKQDFFREMYSNEIESVLTGKSNGEFLGFDKKRYKSGKHKGVVLKRINGGAIIIKTSMEKMLEYRQSFGIGILGTLFNGISKDEGVSYIVLQDTLGIVAASPNISEMTRIKRDPFLIDAYTSGWGYRTLQIDNEEILEVVSSLITNDRNFGLLRIGLTTHAIKDIKHSTVRHFTILFVISLISGTIMFLYVILRQNYMILNAEHDRILLEVRRMEEDTRRSERLTSMGRLAAGVAHEIRNPLNSISIIVQRLKAEFTTVEDEEVYKGYLSTVKKEISRISYIIEQFLKYARPPKMTLTDVSAEEIIKEVLNVVGEKARADEITFSTDIEPGITCKCDADQMKQALLNIVLNALEACNKNGVVTIKTEKRKSAVLLHIMDTGNGIPGDILPKIFDPYFTTKKSGNGLGLSEVHRIITAHGGKITAENVKNGGAVFSIYVPDNGDK